MFALASDTVSNCSVRAQIIPHSIWDEDPRSLDIFTATQREGIRMRFGESSFSSSSTKYVCMLRDETQDKQSPTFTAIRCISSQRRYPCCWDRRSSDSSHET